MKCSLDGSRSECAGEHGTYSDCRSALEKCEESTTTHVRCVLDSDKFKPINAKNRQRQLIVFI